VLYASKTGNTRQVAHAIAEETGAELREVTGAPLPDLSSVKLLFVGDGNYSGRPSKPMQAALEGTPSLAGIKVALFGTYGANAGHLDWLASALTEREAEVLGRFACPGRDRFLLGLFRRRRPSSEDLEAARRFARAMAERIA